MLDDRENLIRSLRDLERRAQVCRALMERDQPIDRQLAAEWVIAIEQWSRLVAVLQRELGDDGGAYGGLDH